MGYSDYSYTIVSSACMKCLEGSFSNSTQVTLPRQQYALLARQALTQRSPKAKVCLVCQAGSYSNMTQTTDWSTVVKEMPGFSVPILPDRLLLQHICCDSVQAVFCWSIPGDQKLVAQTVCWQCVANSSSTGKVNVSIVY